VSLSVTPWWDVLKLRQEVVHASGSIDDVQMSLFQAVYGSAGERPPYAHASYYGEITYPSPRFTELMAQVAVRLGAPGGAYTRAPAFWHLDQAMGGGKSHGLIGLWHLASNSAALARTDVGGRALAEAEQIAGERLSADLGSPQVIVLACDNMTAGKGVQEYDGPAVTLYERFLWRLFGEDMNLWRRYKDYNGDKNKLVEALTAVGRPVLILIDEIMDYVRQLGESDKSDLAVRDMAFLRALFDSVNDLPHVAMVVVMIASDKDSIALTPETERFRYEMEQQFIKYAKPATINDNTDFAAILRRRLFDAEPPTEVLKATTRLLSSRMTGPWKDRVFAQVPATSRPDFPDEIGRCYPFHPQLMAMAEQEWAKLAGFQKVRSTIRVFAATVYSLVQRAEAGEWAPMLIGPGDLPLSDAAVREAILGSGLIADTRTQANYRQIASADIVGADDRSGSARLLDRERTDSISREANPRAAERAAACLFLCSIVGSRGGGRQGATEAELKAAMFVPDPKFAYAEAEAILANLMDVENKGLASVDLIPGRGGQAPRFFMSTRQTLNMLVRSARATITDEERDAEILRTAERLTVSGPFKIARTISGNSGEPARVVMETAAFDERETRLLVLDHRQFSLLNGLDKETRTAIRAAMGLGDDKIPVNWASSAVFAVASTRGRAQARTAAAAFLAWDRVASMDDVRADEDLLEKARDEKQEARRTLDGMVKRAYQHAAYLGEGDSDAPRVDRLIEFQQENQTTLDGQQVWKALVEADKAFGVGELTGRALVFNLVESDYGRPLDEVRDSFWNSPRKPLLANGETDLQRAVYEAITASELSLVGADGVERVVTRPGDIGVGQASLRLAKPSRPGAGSQAPRATSSDSDSEEAGVSGSGSATTATGGMPTGGATRTGGHPAQERRVTFSLRTALDDTSKRDAVYSLFRALANAVDGSTASYAEAQIRLVIAGDVAEEIERFAREAGCDVTTQDM
jgi:hypothetical protein